MSAGPTVAIRADGNAVIGLGHVMRCATLAQSLVDAGAQVTFLSRSLPDPIASKLCKSAVVTLAEGLDSSAVDSSDIVVVDGYHLVDEVVANAHRCRRMVMIDDNLELPVDLAAVVINQNLHASEAMYPTVDGQSLLIGPAFVMLRPEVAAIQRRFRQPSAAKLVLISFGGADPQRLTLPTVSLLLEHSSWRIFAAVGPTHPDRPVLDGLSRTEQRLEIGAGDLVEPLSAADVAIIGGGTTLYEVAFLGIPTVAVVTATNQAAATKLAADLGLVVQAPARPEDIFDTLMALDRDGKPPRSTSEAVIDGLGSERVAKAIIGAARS